MTPPQVTIGSCTFLFITVKNGNHSWLWVTFVRRVWSHWTRFSKKVWVYDSNKSTLYSWIKVTVINEKSKTAQRNRGWRFKKIEKPLQCLQSHTTFPWTHFHTHFIWPSQYSCKGSIAAAAAKSLQSCPTLRDPMDCSPPGSSVHGIFQARVLEWGAMAFSRLLLFYGLGNTSSKKLSDCPSSRWGWKDLWHQQSS